MISSLYAAGDAAQKQGGGLMGLLPLVLIFLVFYFLVMRPQKKQRDKHKTFLQMLKVGDDVLSTNGMVGKILTVGEKFVTLEIAKDVKVKILKSYIAGDAKELISSDKK